MGMLASIRYWWNNQGEIDSWRVTYDTLLESFKDTVVAREQLKFLLTSAPLMNVSFNDYELRSRLRASTIAFAYVNPETVVSLIDVGKPAPRYLQIPGSPTKWILTPWMPKGCVLFSPSLMPGIDAA